SPAAFSAFSKLIQKPTEMRLTKEQLLPVTEIIGTKPVDKVFLTQADVFDIGGRHALSVQVTNRTNDRTSHALYVISDTKQRLIQEIGFDGANFKKGHHWADEEERMLMYIEFLTEKK